jgi:hypothetical protein
VPGKVHQLHFSRKSVDVRDVVRHRLPRKQERDYANQSDSEVDPPHLTPVVLMVRILARSP